MVGVAIDSLGSVKVGVQIGTGDNGSGEARSASPRDVIEEEAPVEEVEDAEFEEEPAPKRVWHQRDPKVLPPAPVPFPEGRSDRGPGTSLAYRLAQANAERKEAGLARRREKKQVSNREKELAAQLAAVRNQK